MRLRFILSAATAAVVFLAGCTLSGLGGEAEALDEALIRTAERGELVDEVSESGKIAPAFDVDIKSKVSGEVSAVFVDEGQVVKKGDLLYELVDRDYAREVSLGRVGLRQARVELENAQVELRRKEQAHGSRGISDAEYDLAVRAVDLAAIAVDHARLELQAAEDRLAYTKITSPIDGVVIRRNVEPGEVVTAGMTATVNGEAQLTIAQMDRLLLELELNQVDVAKVQIGHEARILLDAYPGTEVVGKVTRVAASGHLDRDRGIDVFTVKVEVDPSQSELEIKPGMTAEVRIRIGSWPNVVKVPAETIFEEDGKSYVYRVTEADGKRTKEKTEITLGHRSDREVEITSGLGEGDKFYAQADVKDFGARLDG